MLYMYRRGGKNASQSSDALKLSPSHFIHLTSVKLHNTVSLLLLRRLLMSITAPLAGDYVYLY